MASSGLQVRTGAATSVTPCRDAARGWRLTAAGLYGATCGLTCGAAAEANAPPVRGTRLVPASWLQWPATTPWGLGHRTAPASCWGEPELRVPRLKPGVVGPRPWRLPGRCFLPRPWARRHTPPSGVQSPATSRDRAHTTAFGALGTPQPAPRARTLSLVTPAKAHLPNAATCVISGVGTAHLGCRHSAFKAAAFPTHFPAGE